MSSGCCSWTGVKSVVGAISWVPPGTSSWLSEGSDCGKWLWSGLWISVTSEVLWRDGCCLVLDVALERVLDGGLDVLGVLEGFLPLEGLGWGLGAADCSGSVSETLGFSDSGVIPRGQPNALGGKRKPVDDWSYWFSQSRKWELVRRGRVWVWNFLTELFR